MMPRRSLLLFSTSLVLALSSSLASAAFRNLSPTAEVARQMRSPVPVTPRWRQPAPAPANLSSVAAWTDASGRVRVYISDADADRLRILDGATGEVVDEAKASALSLATPTALFVIDDLLLVVEQRNHRVLALGLPDLHPLGSVGDGGLIQPVSLFARHTDVDSYLLYVADDYDDNGKVPADRDLNRRVKSYSLSLSRGNDAAATPTRIDAARVGQLGATEGNGLIRRIGSLGGDPFYDQLLVAERDRGHDSGYRVYGFSGKYRDASLDRDIFQQRAAGITLRACDNGGGHWIASDEMEGGSPLLVMDRASLRPAGAFTDSSGSAAISLWFQGNAATAFPAGVLLVRFDGQLSAIDWRDIARELRLDLACQ